MKTARKIVLFFALVFTGYLFLSAPQADASKWKKHLKAQAAKCEDNFADSRKNCLDNYRSDRKGKSGDALRKVAAGSQACLMKVNRTYDRCMDPDRLTAAAKGAQKSEAIEKAVAYREKADDKCKARDEKAATKCEKLAASPKYDKCFAKAIKNSSKCYGKVKKKYAKMIRKIK